MARLDTLVLGGLTLHPAFTPATVLYTAATTNATNTITATSSNGTVAILNGSTLVVSGAAATWVAGINHVTVTVTGVDETGIYHIDVTKT